MARLFRAETPTESAETKSKRRGHKMPRHNCPKCGMKFDTKKIGLHQLMKHWAEMQKQGDEAHS
jgi:hypothetical protein